MKDLFNKEFSKPTFIALTFFSIVPMAMGISFGVTLLLLTSATIVGIYLNKGLHKFDLVYIALAYLILLGYLFPKFINLGS